MNRKLLPVLWMILLTLHQLAVSAEVQRPNFVFMFADDFGYGDLACYGHPYVKSPNIDRMASQGTRFNQAYAAGRACNPSRTGLMTAWSNARFPKRTDDFDFQGRETVTSILKKNITVDNKKRAVAAVS